MATVTALPKTGTIGQIVTYNGYNYQWTGVGWKNLGVATVSVGGTGGTTISANGVTTGNTTVSSNGISTGNTSLTGNAVTTTTVTTGNTTVSSNGISTGNTSLTGNALTTTTVTTGNTTVSSNGISTGNTTVSSNGISTGNTSLTGNALTTTTVTTGNTTIDSTGISTGNTSLTGNALTTTTVTTGNTSISSNGVTTGNTTVSSTGLVTGNTSISGNTVTTTTVTTGNTSISDTGLTTGNTSVSSTGISTGNTAITSNGVTTGNTTVSSTGLVTGNTSISGNTVTTTTVTTGNTSISSNGLTTGNTTVTGNSIATVNITAVDGIFSGNLIVSGNVEYVNVTTLAIKDPIIELGNGANNEALITNDGKDRGSLLHYYSGNATDAFMGWKNANSEFVFASNANVSNNVVTINQLGDIRAANAILGNTVTANYFIGNGSLLTGISSMSSMEVTGGSNLATANITTLNVANTANLGNVGNIRILGGSNGYVLTTDGVGNLSWTTLHACVISTISNIVAGSAIDISVDYGNASYPSGVFTVAQLGPVSLTATDIWQGGTAAKNAYANYIAGTINTQNVAITLSLANANFSIQSSDYITIGSSNITGSNLIGLNITGTGGTYTIPSSYLSDTVQTQTSDAVALNLTTSRGVKTATGTTLTNNQPSPFNVNSLTGSFPSSTVPYWSLNQTFNWSAGITGTVASGNVTYGGNATGSLTTSGATSGTSPSLDSTLGYTITSSDYTGAGLNGAGTRTIPTAVTGTIATASKYYPLFWKTTTSSANPNFTTSDTRNSNNFAVGQGASTTATTSNYLWIATPNATAHTFAFTFLGATVAITPDASYTSQTISGQTYNFYGFTNASAVTLIYTAT